MTLQLASCEEQYKRFPELDRAEVMKLVEWQEKQPHLPQLSELEALIFLHACFNSVEKAKTCLDTYFTCRTHCPEFFGKRDVNGAEITAQMKILAMTPLPGTTKEGYRVVLCKLLDTDASKYNYVDSNKLFCMVTDLWLAKEGIAAGHSLVVDMEGSTLAHLAKVNLLAMKKFMYYIQEALPVRLKALHFINATSFMDKLLAMMRPFLKKELLDMIHVHSTMDTFLDKFIPKAIMPKDYGGTADSIAETVGKAYGEMQANQQFYTDEETRRVNEKLRPGKPKTESDIFGTEGNFKQLQFD